MLSASAETPYVVSLFPTYNEWDFSSLLFPPNVESEARIRVQVALEMIREDTVSE